jgi:hypothetical protein
MYSPQNTLGIFSFKILISIIIKLSFIFYLLSFIFNNYI